MIERLIEVLNTAGLKLSHGQLADALWLALHIPPEQNSTRIVQESSRMTAEIGPISEDQPPLPDARAPYTRPGWTLTARRPGELFVTQPGLSTLTPGKDKMPADTVRVPAVEALPHKNAINRALRPLKRRYPSFRTQVLDVNATVEQTANGGPAVPILKAAQERWMEIALILDESGSTRVWRQTFRELTLLLHHHGSFRDVRTWYVNLDDGTMRLYSEAGLPNSPRRLRHPNELIDPLSRRLILVVSDCAAEGWHNHIMFRTIWKWGRRGPVALVQVLPERLWTATALTAYPRMLRSYSAGVPNRSLRAQHSSYEEPSGAPEVLLPIFNLEGWSVAPWAKLVANVGEATAEGIVVRIDDSEEAVSERHKMRIQRADRELVSPEKKLQKFRAAASPAAFELAGYLSVAPLSLPVMRLVQKAMMSEVRQVDLAEFLLGGLVEQVTPPEEIGDVDQVLYEFCGGIRELLQATVKISDKYEVLRKVSRLIERQTRRTIDFQALRADPTGKSQHLVDPVGQKFAEIAADLLNPQPHQRTPLPAHKSWDSNRLDILILGSMGGQEDPTVRIAPIRGAVKALLQEPAFETLLIRAGVSERDCQVHIPEGTNEPEIFHGILSRLDTADLVIFNLTPKAGEEEASPNVFYELALVHALGIPNIIIKTARGAIPFYARTMRQLRVPDLEITTLMAALREPLRDFLDSENSQTNFLNDPVTQFYGLPIVDISAVVGLAIGYYEGFLSRLITEGGFIAAYPDLIRQVVVVRPSGVDSTYPTDMQMLRAALTEAGYTLATEKLAPPAGDTLGQLWFDHVRGIVIDLPRTIYPLQRSPRLLPLRERSRTIRSPAAERAFTLRFRQIGEHLLDRVEAFLRYQLHHDAQRVRLSVVHFTRIGEVSGLVTRLLGIS